MPKHVKPNRIVVAGELDSGISIARENLELIPPDYDWNDWPLTRREKVRDLIARLTGRRYR